MLLALPGLYQFGLLVSAVGRRFGYDYDLEWMEGGTLTHAWRIANGLPVYDAPSVEFVPYLYTPGYPALVAAVGSVFGISYQTARAINILAMLGVVALLGVAVKRAVDSARQAQPDALWWPVGAAAAVAALGVYAVGYPFMEGWYDIARADSVLICMISAGFFGLLVWGPQSRESTLLGGWFDWRIAGCAALLALAFFVKQTGVIFVAAGGAALLFLNWRAAPTYIAVSGVIGLGGTWLGNMLTDGWFFTYIYKYHQRHTNEGERFWGAFEKFGSQFPVPLALVGAGLVALIVYGIARRKMPRTGGQFLFWAWFFAVAVVVGAVGMTTQWSYLNAFIPAFVSGAFATAATVVMLAEIGGEVGPRTRTTFALAGLSALVFLALTGLWQPDKFVPNPQDEEAGDRLVEMLREADGPVFVPYFPWYAYLAGKPLHLHKMSINDVTLLTPRNCPPPEKQKKGEECVVLPEGADEVAGLAESFREERFALAIIERANQEWLFKGLREHYRPTQLLRREDLPQHVTAHDLRHFYVWEPVAPLERPQGARVIFDFESPRLPEWKIRGRAWGGGPTRGTLARQQPVGGYGGERYMNSYHGGDKATGTAISPTFTLRGETLMLRVGGGKQPGVRVELRSADGTVLRTARGTNSEILRAVRWDVSDWKGEQVRLALIDETSDGWGHISVDEVWELSGRTE